jgi:sigma-B regulation protein RsbU (phosphoserine phosphatase)
MMNPEPEFARSEVLRIFNESQLYIIIGSAIATMGLIAAAFSLLRRRRDPLLLWLTVFAVLYGARLILGWQMVWPLGLHPPIFQRFVIALGFLIPIPALFFFRSLKLLDHAAERVTLILVPVEVVLAVATFFVGPNATLQMVNNALVLFALAFLVISLLRNKSHSPDVKPIRIALFLFIASAVYDNVGGLTGNDYSSVPFSVLILLGALGFVAARRTLANEQQLSIIQKELEIARRIQLSILPDTFPASTRFRVAARYLPMTTVAGDFYDFLVANDNEAGLLIADVAGHGVPAALIASMVKFAATTQRPSAADPAGLLHGMNQTLCGHTQNQFVTAGYVYLNAETRELRYSAAGHPPMLLLRNGQVTELTENGLMLAAFDFARFTTLTHAIEPGDRIVLYTDGLPEAANDAKEEFGPARLRAEVERTDGLSPKDAIDSILASIQAWSAEQDDDCTILICDYTA